MQVNIYGPEPDKQAITALLAYVPLDAELVIIQAPPRNAIDRRPCQHPGWLMYSASVDNRLFIHLTQRSVTAKYEIKVTT